VEPGIYIFFSADKLTFCLVSLVFTAGHKGAASSLPLSEFIELEKELSEDPNEISFKSESLRPSSEFFECKKVSPRSLVLIISLS
jgi:hypothetical protein